MVHARDLLNKPIIDARTGTIIGTTDDVVLDTTKNKVLALLIHNSKLSGNRSVIPAPYIKAIGPDAITIPSADGVINRDDDPEIERTLKDNQIIRGLKVISENGRDLGVIEDFQFDEATGKVIGYIVSGGMLKNMAKGTSSFPPVPRLKIGKDVALVPEEVATLLEQQVGGWSEKMGRAKDSLKESTSQLGEKTKETTQNLQPRTPELSNKTSDAWDKTKSKGEDLTNKFTQSVTSTWEQVKEKAQDVKEQATEKIEEKRIQSSLGRTVDRVILDPQDNVIINRGEIITHRTINRATEAGVLDMLLSSAHTPKSGYQPEDLRMKESTKQPVRFEE